jgi:hypothetical protein
MNNLDECAASWAKLSFSTHKTARREEIDHHRITAFSDYREIVGATGIPPSGTP